MSESHSETVPVVLSEEQLLRLASAVATSLTAYFEAKEEQSSVVLTDPVLVTVSTGLPGADPQEGTGAADPTGDDGTSSPDTGGQTGPTAEETGETPAETALDAGTETPTTTGTDTGSDTGSDTRTSTAEEASA
ncbi:hypothetical protein [Streptomyces sp. NBC_01314]|uniref:hypothetical protein n=1 Tax=Streptomyces sp. NBC_01314 TaxID=2903821 RepID=UPI00308A8133|nr:hypothetical protein OG622_30875 [Streptomyces sp. NBC_01314]